MKFNRAFWLSIPIIALLSCGEDDTPSPAPSVDNCTELTITATTLEVLPLGDSRVEGDRPLYESYRYELWKLLIDNQWDVDYIGSRSDNADYPSFQDFCFDTDHEGTSGATTLDILDILSQTSFARNPDVVLLGIGGNDLLDFSRSVEEVVASVEQIIIELRTRNNQVIIFVEQIAPGQSIIMTAENTQIFNDFNDQVLALATNLSTQEAPVVAVDMATGWNDSFLADLLHYNNAGAQRIAQRYFEAMDNIIDP